MFLDEIESVQKEADVLTRNGVDIIVALGHAGYEKDREIAAKVAQVDVVVGGHSNTFLFPSDLPWPSTEKPEGPYPTLIQQKSGKTVPVVQAYAFTKYLGYLNMTFDENGDLTHFKGKPILLDSSWGQDDNVLAQLKPWSDKVQAFSERIIGSTRVALRASRKEESNLANFVVDSMVHYVSAKVP